MCSRSSVVMWPKVILVVLLASLCRPIPCSARNTSVSLSTGHARASFRKRGILDGDSIKDSWRLLGQGHRERAMRSLLRINDEGAEEHLLSYRQEFREHLARSGHEFRDHLSRSRQEIIGRLARSGQAISRQFKHSGRQRLREIPMFRDAELQEHPWLHREYFDHWHKKGLPDDVMLFYGNLVTQANSNPDTVLLGPEKKEKWARIRESWKPDQITVKTQQEIKDWFGKNMSLSKASVYVVLDRIEWNLKRFSSEPVHIWWTSSQIKLWTKKSANWKLMIEIGDILDFHTHSQSHTFAAENLPELRRNLQNVMYEFQGPHKPTSEHWGISQSIIALKSVMGAALYDHRINQILGPRKLAGDMDQLLDALETRDLKLHWFFYGLDPVEAEKIGKGLWLSAKSLSHKEISLVEEEKDYIRQFQIILDSQFEKEEGYTDHSFMEEWYASVLGEDEYRKRVQEVHRLYRGIVWSDFWRRMWTLLPRRGS